MTAAAIPARLTRRSASPSRRVAPGLRAASSGGAPCCESQRQLRVGNGDRRQHGGVDTEEHDEVERQESERPADGRPRVEMDGEPGEHAESHAGDAEREAATPVQA